MRECNTGSYPKSVAIFLTILQKWNYDFHPKTALEYEGPLNQLKKEIESRGSAIFQEMIKSYLLENVHRVVLELLPSESFEEEQLKVCLRLKKIMNLFSMLQLKSLSFVLYVGFVNSKGGKRSSREIQRVFIS